VVALGVPSHLSGHRPPPEGPEAREEVGGWRSRRLSSLLALGGGPLLVSSRCGLIPSRCGLPERSLPLCGPAGQVWLALWLAPWAGRLPWD